MSIPKCKDFSDYNRYPSDPNPTTDADMQEYMDNQNALMKIIAGLLWQPNTSYEVDQQVMSNSLPSGAVAIVVTAGRSGENEPTWGELNSEVADGSVVWKVSRQKSGGDGVPIGTHSWWFGEKETIPQGWIALDGAEYDVNGICSALYPIFGNKYGGTPGETFNVPNLIGKWVKGDRVAGTELEAGLPNITGFIGFSDRSRIDKVENAFIKQNPRTLNYATNTTGLANGSGDISFDASRSSSIYGNADTVQPPSLTAIPIIKAFSAEVESVDPTTEQQLRADITLHSGEIADIKNNLGLQMDLLWTNANLSTAFAPQTLSMDLTKYKMVYIMFVEMADGGTRSATKVGQLAIVGDKVLLQTQYPLGFSTATRFCTVNSNGIVFEGGYFHNATNANTSNNQQCTPYKIYGIK